MNQASMFLKVDTWLMDFLAKSWDISYLRKGVEALGYVREDTRMDVPSTDLKSSKRQNSLDGYFQDIRLFSNSNRVIESELLPVLRDRFAFLVEKFKIPKKFDVIHYRKADMREMLRSSLHIGELDQIWYTTNLSRTSNFLILLTEWKKQSDFLKLQVKPSLILDSRDTTPWDALALMAHSSNFIGSNSTLSWWGGYVGTMLGSKVVLPDNWSQHNNVENERFRINGVTYSKAVWSKQ